ncbi:hypothetical protein LQ564_09010 [Massilia sp. G4R7]|uniref:Uncharacterized protein n=1 Tax=Massilia phyllostachyos TaxID=2898585 RepID=A0ABS8Q3Y9_9BURK|nr:hypothetical protein [Massilia phyllostachyos]MCD2516449.1 hypothetical protein [Massilia phyllostachyos]
MPTSRPMSRAFAVRTMRARLLRDSFPRVQMFILVSLTGAVGFAASAAMLLAGIETMALRYALAMGAAYLAFLALLWVWLHTSASDYLDVFPVDGSDGPACGPGAARDDFTGGGGSFDGGGASANVDFGTEGEVGASIVEKPLAAIGHAEEGAIPLAVILLALGLLSSSLFVVWTAPVLFAEILVDAFLAAGLYRRLRHLDRRHWMVAAVRRTAVPFVLTTLLVAGAGWGMQAAVPEARSIGGVVAGR